ncbi:MAG: winged helix-turn-helix transcriptional regulator [Halalkalicoccus sp.]|nr:winged helix-turn-helix transcriptional regulator [Halalkalicoccus sp.]
MADTERAGSSVLRSKRDATRYQILVEIAERQPAVSQQEIADAIGVTAQAVSDYLQGLVEEGFVEKGGRGRYEVSKEGVDWLISRTDELREFTAHVAEDVIGQVEIETALATGTIEEGWTVTLSMVDGVLRATPGENGGATAVAVTSADEGQDVGITDFQGVLGYELGEVTVVSLPRVHEGGSALADPETIAEYAAEHDLVATAGTEAVAAANAAALDPEIRFGTPDAIREAATKGLDVLLLAADDRLAAHTEQLREGTIGYQMVEAADR